MAIISGTNPKLITMDTIKASEARKVHYGLTSYNMQFYRELVAYGYHHDKAMQKLKELYQSSKNYWG